MHTEHLQNVRPAGVAFGWFISVAVASLLMFAFKTLGLIGGQSGGNPWVVVALLVGFTLGGWFTGARVGTAPILHGVFMGLFSILVWLVANLIGELVNAATWDDINASLFAGGLLVQMISAAVGASIASRGRRAVVPRV